MGLGVGINDLSYTRDALYSESMENVEFPGAGAGNTVDAGFDLNNHQYVTGTGYNFKFGVIVKPINRLRFGAAIHTPTYYSLTKSTSGTIDYSYSDGGTDPLAGDAGSGLGMRTLSAFSLPYEKMNGGYASHFGINPGFFRGHTDEEKGLEFRDKVIGPLFFNEQNRSAVAPFYLYVNVTTPDVLRKVLADPAKYAPSGVYIMRIHGTFVNFLDLSPAIQNDIIKRLDLESTRLA